MATISREVAELHALLQTAEKDRSALEASTAGLQEENASLTSRLGMLAGKSHEYEKTLETVLARKEALQTASRQQATELEHLRSELLKAQARITAHDCAVDHCMSGC